MFYAGMAAPLGSGIMSIGRATSTVANPTSWTQDPSNPIITGPRGDSIRLDSVQLLAATWYLYSTDFTAGTILLYTSADGVSFSEYGTVLSGSGQGCSDGTVVSQGAVLYDAGTWRMYYNWEGGGQVNQGIRYATSSDGKNWNKTNGSACQNILSVGGATDSAQIEWHQILKIGSYYLLSYEGYNGSNWSANIAYSSSPGQTWQKSAANPVFSPSGVPGSFDQNHVATPAYFDIGGTWYLFYQGSAAAAGGTNYSFSHWSMGIAALPNGNDPSAAIP